MKGKATFTRNGPPKFKTQSKIQEQMNSTFMTKTQSSENDFIMENEDEHIMTGNKSERSQSVKKSSKVTYTTMFDANIPSGETTMRNTAYNKKMSKISPA